MRGRPALGLYPNIRREFLAKRLNKSKETIVRILRGSQAPSLQFTSELAAALNTPVETLIASLQTEREKYERRTKPKAPHA